MIERRTLLVLGAAALASPRALLAQTSSKVVRIGFLVPTTRKGYAARVEGLKAGLRELGYVERCSMPTPGSSARPRPRSGWCRSGRRMSRAAAAPSRTAWTRWRCSAAPPISSTRSSMAPSLPHCRSSASTQFELTVNMKTLKALGIILPQTVLIRADKVIE